MRVDIASALWKTGVCNGVCVVPTWEPLTPFSGPRLLVLPGATRKLRAILAKGYEARPARNDQFFFFSNDSRLQARSHRTCTAGVAVSRFFPSCFCLTRVATRRRGVWCVSCAINWSWGHACLWSILGVEDRGLLILFSPFHAQPCESKATASKLFQSRPGVVYWYYVQFVWMKSQARKACRACLHRSKAR